jgi:hypothetical protein
MTPWRYFAASGPETEISLREVSRAMPDGEGPSGAECRGAEREKARRWVGLARQVRQVNGAGLLTEGVTPLAAEAKTLRAGCIVVSDRVCG